MQLFTHLLSSYLQGKGDFFSALPWGGMGRGRQWSSRPLGRAWGGAYTSSSNSVGVAIPQPRVAGEARYPGYPPHQP